LDDGQIVDEGTPEEILNAIDFKPQSSKPDQGHEKDPEDVEIEREMAEDEEEGQERGSVKFDIYRNYWAAVGHYLSPAILISLTLMQACKTFL
jgi:hypothetical protein